MVKNKKMPFEHKIVFNQHQFSETLILLSFTYKAIIFCIKCEQVFQIFTIRKNATINFNHKSSRTFFLTKHDSFRRKSIILHETKLYFLFKKENIFEHLLTVSCDLKSCLIIS